MRKITTVSMGEQLDSFVQRMIESGRYGNASEVVRSGLRLLENQEANDAALRKLVMAGLESGESELTLKEIANQQKSKHNV